VSGAAGAEARHPQLVFLVPSPTLGRVEDVFPERLSQQANDWIGHSREILKKKRKAVLAGQWKTTTYIGEEHEKIKPVTAEHCPAMNELDSVGFVLKWPATAILRKVAPKGWQIKPSSAGNFNFYRYSPLTSFTEAGEAEAIAVETGWTVVAPPGWSVLFKNLPNVFSSGLSFAEGIVRADQATIPLSVHALITPGAETEIKVKRGDPMAVVLCFKREPVELAVVTDPGLVDETAKAGERLQASFGAAGGVYRKLFQEGEQPTPLYPRMLEAWKAEHAAKKP
jgi:hypothetical protein